MDKSGKFSAPGIFDIPRIDRLGGAQRSLEAFTSPIAQDKAEERWITQSVTAPLSAQGSPNNQSAAFFQAELKARSARNTMTGLDCFSDPAWDMVLYLMECLMKGRNVAVTDLCYASNAPATTALRYVRHLEEAEFLVRRCDPRDARRKFIELSPRALESLNRYLQFWGDIMKAHDPMRQNGAGLMSG